MQYVICPATRRLRAPPPSTGTPARVFFPGPRPEITIWHGGKKFFSSVMYTVKLLYKMLIVIVPMGLQAGTNSEKYSI